ncbi:MAG: hypothetical protein QOC69_4658 [Mycobacterium sp.]|jgi:hypothetical protein|nr:hypothetical protein [Mycobacterium sp.]
MTSIMDCRPALVAFRRHGGSGIVDVALTPIHKIHICPSNNMGISTHFIHTQHFRTTSTNIINRHITAY